MRNYKNQDQNAESGEPDTAQNRRQFLRDNIRNAVTAAAGLGGLGYLLNDSFGAGCSRARNEQKLKDTFEKMNPDDARALKSQIGLCGSALPENRTDGIKKAALQGILLELSKAAISHANTQMQLGLDPLLNKPSDRKITEWMKRDPAKYLSFGLVVAPIAEEMVFRMFPSEMVEMNGSHGRALHAGIPLSLLFSLTHNIVNDPEKGIKITKNWGIETDRISIPTFVSGLIFWGLQRNHGIDAAVTAHMTNNATSAVISWMNELFGDKSD